MNVTKVETNSIKEEAIEKNDHHSKYGLPRQGLGTELLAPGAPAVETRPRVSGLVVD